MPTGDWHRQRSADERDDHMLANLYPHVSGPSERSGGQLLGPLVGDRDGQKRQQIKHPRKGVINLSEFASTGRLTGAQFCELQHKCRVVRHQLFHFYKLVLQSSLQLWLKLVGVTERQSQLMVEGLVPSEQEGISVE